MMYREEPKEAEIQLPPLDSYIPEIRTAFENYLIDTLSQLNPNKYEVTVNTAGQTIPVTDGELDTIVRTVSSMLDGPNGMDIGGIIDYVYELQGLP